MKEIQDILQQRSLNILIIGDGCCDLNHYGKVTRISQEAPVPIFDLMYTESAYGMSYNVAENFKALGVKNINLQTYVVENKHRYIEKGSYRQVYRVDEKVKSQEVKLSYAGVYDCIVIPDYDKGLVPYDLIEEITNNATVPIFIDTKKPDLARFTNCIVKINEHEYNDAISEAESLVVTRADKDVLVIENGKTTSTHHVEPIEIADVTGAGDSFFAAFVTYYMLTDNKEKAIEFAIKSSQISVQHRGVYAPKLEEICKD